MLSCPFCLKVFKVRGNLNTHLIGHTKEKPYKCLTCSASFGHADSLKKYSKSVHDGIKRTTCVQEKNWKCSVCSYKCINKHKLANHLLKHSTVLPFSCGVPGCGFRTKYGSNLPQHVRRMHTDERPHGCTSEGCDYTTNSLCNLRRHVKVHSEDKPFVCQQQGCKFTSKYKSSLANHMYNVHSEEKPLKCSTCDFQTTYKFILSEHEDKHNNIKRFYCEFPKCGFATNRNFNLQLHIGSKHTKKDIVCTKPRCNFRCGTSTLLQRHVYRKHLLPILKCPDDTCNFYTRSSWDLHLHVSSRHKELEVDSSLAPERYNIQTAIQTGPTDALICPFQTCDYQTEFQHRYDRHITAHDNEHICNICSYRCQDRPSLRRHIQKHVGEKLQNCPYCEYSVTYSSVALRQHAGKSHQIHVISHSQGQDWRNWNCRTCRKLCASYSEFVLHSMTHLKAVVVLRRLKFQVL